jgi:hypothetical protein
MSLSAKLNTSRRLAQSDLPCRATKVLGAFVNHAQAQSGRHIPPASAASLIGQAQSIIDDSLAANNCSFGHAQGLDSDEDGVGDSSEQALGTALGAGDSDGDTLSDGSELLETGTDPVQADTDLDGCGDAAELGTDAPQGGLRDPLSFWDFFDVPAGSSLQRDGAVSVADISAIVTRFGASGDPDGDPLSRPPRGQGNRSVYHPAYDRGGSAGPNVWNLLPPDGTISVGDILAAVQQFGHACA